MQRYQNWPVYISFFNYLVVSIVTFGISVKIVINYYFDTFNGEKNVATWKNRYVSSEDPDHLSICFESSLGIFDS